MKQKLSLTLFSLCASLAAACQPRTMAPPQTGIEFELRAASPDALPPDGVFRVEGLDRQVAAHIPAAPLDPAEQTQRVALPPGSYTVSYVPVDLPISLGSTRARSRATVVSQNPFRVVVSDGTFTKVRIVAKTAEPAELSPERATQTARID